MASTYSNLKFELIATGEQSGAWGDTTNTNIGIAVEQALVGMATLDSSDFTANVATLTLSDTPAAQDARALCLNIAAGAVSSAGTVNVPAIQKPYIVINGSSFTVTVKVSGQTGVAVPAGKRTVVYNNGTDVGTQVNWLAALEAPTFVATTQFSGPHNGTVGATTPNTGTFTTLTLSGGTANGVAYLNGSKVLTTGSALTFDGTNFATTGSVTSAGSSNSGNLTFTGTGNRITGDFSNATLANRVYFQSSTANSLTSVGLIPNGTGIQTQLSMFGSTDVTTNFSLFDLSNTSSEARFRQVSGGTAPFLPMTFYTGGSERMRVDTSGNVGIGTSSPGAKLDVYSSGTTSTLIRTHNDTTSVYLDANNGYSYLNTFSNHPMLFGTNNTERARIDSSGNFLVNQTSNGAANKNSFALSPGDATAYWNQSGTSTGWRYFSFSYNGTQIGTITQTGGTATAYNTSSDYRLKEDIQPMTGALAKVAALKPCTYKWKVDGSDGEGFIAHELQEVCPSAVTGEKDAVDAEGKPVYQGIDTSFLVATLTAAIQEQQAIITALTARVAALESN